MPINTPTDGRLAAVREAARFSDTLRDDLDGAALNRTAGALVMAASARRAGQSIQPTSPNAHRHGIYCLAVADHGLISAGRG